MSSLLKNCLILLLVFQSLSAVDDIQRTIERNVPVDERESPTETVQEQEQEVEPELQEQDVENLEAAKAYTEGDIKKAFHLYMRKIEQKPCDGRALGGLLKIASVWSLDQKHREQALRIYQIANRCKPNNPEILYFMGRVLMWLQENHLAIETLERVLEIDPNYTDAVTLLVKIYARVGKFKSAYELLEKYPDFPERAQDEALLAYRQKHYARAERLYGQLLEKKPDDIPIRRGYARSLSAQRKYRAAKQQYAELTRQEPKNDLNWRSYMGTRSFTDVSVFMEGSYTKAKETDPDIKAPVVRDFYTIAAYHINVPIRDWWKLIGKQIFFHQKEDDIYPPMGINYNVYVYGAQLKSDVLMGNFFKWVLTLRLLGARGYNNNVFFPFQTTTRFEPGTSITYTAPLMYAILDAHVESFIFKNQDKRTSGLMRQIYLHAGYLFRPNLPLRPQIEVTFDEVFYHDEIRNRRNTENIWGRFDLFTRFAQCIYRFEHSSFKQTTSNYYSFKRQFRNTIGGKLRIEFLERAYAEGEYQYRWEYTIGLDQPIGGFVFQTDVQRLQSYKVIMKLGYRVRDRLRIEAAGHIFYLTLPYEDFNVRGSMLWQF